MKGKQETMIYEKQKFTVGQSRYVPFWFLFAKPGAFRSQFSPSRVPTPSRDIPVSTRAPVE